MALTQDERTTFQVEKKKKKKVKTLNRYCSHAVGTYYMDKNAHFFSHAE